ncbi:MAG: hypothetical protein ACI9ES_001623 [Oceanospirillaceae bacterium]|jgi:hypothetical protein
MRIKRQAVVINSIINDTDLAFLNTGEFMLPMGTIMAGCMVLGVIFTSQLPVLKRLQALPSFILKAVASIVLFAGLWNVLWYASQHLGEFWGNAALVSGALMIVTASYTLLPSKLPAVLIKIRGLVLSALFACSFLYGFTIYNL